MERNESLIAFLMDRLNDKISSIKYHTIETVIENIKICPLELNMEDAADLIGVDDYILLLFKKFFASKEDHYIPKEGSIPRKMLHVLHTEYPKKLQKPDIENRIGNKSIQKNNLDSPKQSYNSWSSMNILISHNLVEKSQGIKPFFSLTEKGLELSNKIFGSRFKYPSQHPTLSAIVSTAEIECRVSVDVKEILVRSKIEWEGQKLPIGSIWFSNGDQIYDVIIQFANITSANDEYIKKNLSASPFSLKIIIIPSKESPSHSELKIRMNLEYGINIIFAETVPLITSYLVKLSSFLENNWKTIGTFEEVEKLCQEQKYAKTIGSVWKEQLKLIPGAGPNLAANLSASYQTPHQLIHAIKHYINPNEELAQDIYLKWGRRPRKNTTESIIHLFSSII
ncbi:hypothetical protein TRFO_25382 [Tritrichomonas foetus]|uniref:Crossover junction endonuclease MUS81 n=1 Tax=Tritrichomonas foetus TaxID=1144522 RepID=A0A1J4K5A1_9EUKA|nr:hypothetical protein TRFO_25382 [Tritrichomonas foetus]|eukprot:OHT06567.1 hypothetical protein TRFO_25382 [Tritrichomonas foetus]